MSVLIDILAEMQKERKDSRCNLPLSKVSFVYLLQPWVMGGGRKKAISSVGI